MVALLIVLAALLYVGLCLLVISWCRMAALADRKRQATPDEDLVLELWGIDTEEPVARARLKGHRQPRRAHPVRARAQARRPQV